MSLIIRFGDNLTTSRGFMPLDTAIRAAIRRCLADEIERLLDMVDALDGDPDLEETGDDEPSLWVASMSTLHDRLAPTDDREEDAGDEGEPDEDREPALGWLINGGQASGDGGLDLEEEFW